MSRGNVELVLRAYEAYNRRDIEALQGLCHEDCIVYTALEGRAEPQPFRGRNEIRAWIENENELWESIRIDDLDVREIDDDRVLTSAVAFVRGRGSGIEMTMPVWSIFELRGGQILSNRSYPDQREALDAAGLSE